MSIYTPYSPLLENISCPIFNHSVENTVLNSCRARYQNTAQERGSGRISLWILEWPEQAAIGWAWPDLDGDLDEDFDTQTRKREWSEHWWRTYGENMFYLASNKGINSRLCWPCSGYEVLSKSNAEMLGLGMQGHGCTRYTVLFFDYGSARDGEVWGIEEMYDIQAVED
jgi:hypothetical protein